MHFHSNLNPFPDNTKDYQTDDHAPTTNVSLDVDSLDYQKFNLYRRFNQPPSSVKNNPWQKA